MPSMPADWQLRNPTPAPAVVWKDGFGGLDNLKNYRGRVVVLNLWATWCTPCVKEMPALDALANRYAPAGLAVLPVSVDKLDAAEVVDFFTQLNLAHLPLLQDKTGSIVGGFGVSKLPTTFLIDRAGMWLATIEGYTDWQGADTQLKLQAILRTGTEDASTTAPVGTPIQDIQF
ncbi:MAG: TlpA disulfide reductase family protein [Alphaproteobacteria bacterium]